MGDREDSEPPPIIREPSRPVVYRATLVVCALGVLVESVLWIISDGGFRAGDFVRLPILTSAYWFLALYVWIQRRRTAASWVLLASTVVLAVIGLSVAGVHCYHSLTTGAPPRFDGTALGLTVCFRWFMLAAVGALLKYVELTQIGKKLSLTLFAQCVKKPMPLG